MAVAAGPSGKARNRPNILITGTPGTGKSITATEVSSRTNMIHIDCGELARQHNFYEGWDEQYQCHVLDEDKVVIIVINYSYKSVVLSVCRLSSSIIFYTSIFASHKQFRGSGG